MTQKQHRKLFLEGDEGTVAQTTERDPDRLVSGEEGGYSQPRDQAGASGQCELKADQQLAETGAGAYRTKAINVCHREVHRASRLGPGL